MFGHKCKYRTDCIRKYLESNYEYFLKWCFSCPASKCSSTGVLKLEHLYLLNWSFLQIYLKNPYAINVVSILMTFNIGIIPRLYDAIKKKVKLLLYNIQ